MVVKSSSCLVTTRFSEIIVFEIVTICVKVLCYGTLISGLLVLRVVCLQLTTLNLNHYNVRISHRTILTLFTNLILQNIKKPNISIF